MHDLATNLMRFHYVACAQVAEIIEYSVNSIFMVLTWSLVTRGVAPGIITSFDGVRRSRRLRDPGKADHARLAVEATLYGLRFSDTSRQP